VDGHAHLHPCFDVPAFVGACRTNLEAAAGRIPESGNRQIAGAVMLLEVGDSNTFDRLREIASHNASEEDEIDCPESTSIVLRRSRASIVFVRGRQVATRDGLEVLVLNTARRYPPGRPVDESVARALDDGLAVVIPWGFGKWWLGRGRIVAGLIERHAGRRLFVGDNSCRLQHGHRPALFTHARDCGVFDLPGSDPLPFRDQVRKPGSFGFALPCELDLSSPAASIDDALSALTTQPHVYGSGDALGAFAWAQLRMQLRKRVGLMA
jgi:hypothetical protein